MTRESDSEQSFNYIRSVGDWGEIDEGVNLAREEREQVEKAIFLQNFNIEKEKKYALVFGNEVYGVAQKAIELCDGTIEIPQLGTKHSLNIAVSCGVVVWDLFQKYLKTNRI
jgi:tRNA G18 (ribose-2'-O)-methylase SpoU